MKTIQVYAGIGSNIDKVNKSIYGSTNKITIIMDVEKNYCYFNIRVGISLKNYY